MVGGIEIVEDITVDLLSLAALSPTGMPDMDSRIEMVGRYSPPEH
jgi:hypothetical protein